MDEDVQHAIDAKEIWKDFLDRQQFEHQLIDRKTGWMLSAESIMFTAFSLSLENGTSHVGTTFRLVLPALGLTLALLWWFAIERLIESKRLSWESYRDYFDKHSEPILPTPCYGVQKCSCECNSLQWGVETRNTRRSLLPESEPPWL